MRRDFIATGIVLMAVGAGAYFYLVENVPECGTFMENFDKILESNTLCQLNYISQIVTIGLGIAGLGLSIDGAVAKGEAKFRGSA